MMTVWGMASSGIRDYRDLLAWQQAIELAVECEAVCDALPRRAWQLASQIRRAANSVHSNIAEGNGRATTPDYLRHLSMANGSLREIESDLHFIARKYSGIGTTKNAQQRATVVAMLLSGLRKA